MNRSVPISNQVEFVNVNTISPLVSKCDIKILYTGLNRNRSFISKEVANKMAESLPTTPIVGEYLVEVSDFGDHGDEELIIDDSGIRFAKKTVPYGFIPNDAKIWWQNYMDKDGVEREYLMTQGYLWTGRYPETSRVVEKGNGQSMELDRDSLIGEWSKSENGQDEYFIINRALFSALCILGEAVEPCFEGGSVTKSNNLVYSLNKDDFKSQMLEFMLDLKTALNDNGDEGGNGMSVENKDLNTNGEENKDQENGSEFDNQDKTQEEEFAKKKKDEENAGCDPKNDEDADNKEDSNDDSNSDEDADDEDKKKKKGRYTLEEVVEYKELLVKFEELQGQFNLVSNELNSIKPEYEKLKELQVEATNKAKDEMINSFYMLSNEDKKDVIDNKLNYSLDEIEAKLSVICVRNKVNFNLDNNSETENNTEKPITTFNVDNASNDSTPAWLKAVDRITKRY